MLETRHFTYSTALLMACMVGFSACKSKNTAVTEDRSIPVLTEKVSVQPVAQEISVSGNIEGNKTVRLGFLVAGKINHISANEGQTVRSGQLIASLDPASYNIAKELADIQVNQVTDEYERLKKMHERNSIAESDFRKVDFALQGARVQQKLHDKNLADTKLYAPFSGVLLKKLAEPGEIVAQGMPILVVSDIQKVKVSAYIPESQLSLIRIGQMANVQVSALGETFEGKIVEVGGAADVTTRAFTVKIEVPNPKQIIRPGMIAEVTIPSTEEKSVLAIPATAILRTPEGQAYVFVADNGIAYQRNVSVGGIYGDKVEILSGLTGNETLVTGGQHRLTNGSRISVNQN